MLEVYQFARDAAVAEAWVLSHETYLVNQDLGVSVTFAVELAQDTYIQRLTKLSCF